ncbi:TetR/AcrR family transcriptional regulator [Streptomyces sp. WM6378]|uniref:TetR/AcrR family transcriptional regulator n=1 Tax=Streptomyces sp. WM6378 TaxID=1415557 RepID=UPI0006AE3893|nr:TetR-like C-terminal domain-containing protein [Streptomyces sp. WM6378]KOU33011.1 transcriptional regulator [Streptomyces sp. WM6378]
MSTARERILAATTELIASQSAEEISTRSICAKAQVGAPEISRQFGGKRGLMAVVADRGFERFLASKRKNPRTEDPVADVRTAWDSHVRFALENPHLYRLMFTPDGEPKSQAVKEAQALLLGVLGRCEAAGRLVLAPVVAGQAILAANVGVCLMMLSFPELFGDLAVSEVVRDAVLGKVTGQAQEDGDAGKAAAAVLARALVGTLSGTVTVEDEVVQALSRSLDS